MFKDRKAVNIILIVLTSLYLVFFVTSSFTFNFYYPFAHLNDTYLFSFFYVLFQMIRFSSFIILPLAVFCKYKTLRILAKSFLLILTPLNFIYYNTYTSLSKLDPTLPYYNKNNLSVSEIEINNKVNLFFPSSYIKAEFIIELILIFAICLLILLTDSFKKEEIKFLSFYPIFLLLSLPLNIFENVARGFSEKTTSFFLFDNYNLVHFILLAVLIGSTILSTFILRKKEEETQFYVLRIMALVMFLLFLSKNSMIIGDGYNIYNNIFSSVPLFICDIGKFIVLLSVFTKKKIFYDIAFFVHSAGALTVFFYLGKSDNRNFETVFSYAFLYFTITHILLFLLSVLPVYLKRTSFHLKDTISGSVYYFCVIIVAAFTSVAVSNYSLTWTDSLGNTLSTPFTPNYAFTQNCPLPIEFPTAMSLEIGHCDINFVYEISLFLSYVGLFLAFLGVNYIIFFIEKKIDERKGQHEKSI